MILDCQTIYLVVIIINIDKIIIVIAINRPHVHV